MIRNRSVYNASLKKRCNIDFIISSNLSEGWYEEKPDKNIRARPKQYSDFAIEQCLKIRYLFGLKLGYTQGFIKYFFEKSGLN